MGIKILTWDLAGSLLSAMEGGKVKQQKGRTKVTSSQAGLRCQGPAVVAMVR